MDIKLYLPCKKTRSSNRLQEKVKEEKREKTIQLGELGYFNILPIEMRFYLLKYLTVDDLGYLTIVSKAMRNLIEAYYTLQPILTKDLIERLHAHSYYPPLPVEKQADCFNTFCKLGLLTKRSTCLYATKERLKFINEVLTKLTCANYLESCEDLKKCIAMICFGKFMHTVIAGWDDCECVRVYDAVCAHTSIMKNANLVVSSKQGGHQRLEFEIRCFYRQVFLDQSSCLREKGFWLTRILKPWPLVHQARLLYLLYGPVMSDEVMWYEPCENIPSNSEQAAKQLGDMANAIQILHHYNQEWSEDDVISIIDELTSAPDEWLSENMAHLLILCGEDITSKLLISKAINGRLLDLSRLTTSFCVVCVKSNFSLKYVMSMIKHVLSVIENDKERKEFFNNIMDMFKELILDIHDFEEDQANEMFFMVTSLVEFSKKIIGLAFKEKLSKS